MIAYVKDASEDRSLEPLFRPMERELTQLHGKTLVKGKTYNDFYVPLSFDRMRYAHPNFRPDLMNMELKYLGKRPCNDEDTANSCAHIEFRMKEIDPKKLLYDKTSVAVAIDLILEPHSLLLHKVDYEAFSVNYTNRDLSIVGSNRRAHIDIQFNYEELPE